MNKKLLAALRTMNEVDFHVLTYHIETAKWCREIMSTYELTDEDMAKKLGLTKNNFKRFKNGAYEYSIKDWATMQAIRMELISEKVRIKIEGQVTFPAYAHQEKPNSKTVKE